MYDPYRCPKSRIHLIGEKGAFASNKLKHEIQTIVLALICVLYETDDARNINFSIECYQYSTFSK